MSINAVTARSTRLRAANLLGRPTSGRVVPLRRTRLVRTRIPASVSTRGLVNTAVSRAALKRLALRILGPLAVAAPVIEDIGNRVYRKYLDPAGFPGWGTFPDGWTSNPGVPYPGKSPGDYTANGFDNSPNWSTVTPNIIDTSDGSPIGGFRYWGHFNANPLPGGARGVDWPLPTHHILPEPISPPGVRPRALPRNNPRYRKLRDLSPRRAPRWTPRSGFMISLRIGPQRRLARDLKFRINPVRDRDGGDKAKPANAAVFFALKLLANAGGEIKEMVDIFAEAAGYDDWLLRKAAGFKGLVPVPASIDDGGHETQRKIFYLFWVEGINAIDFDLLFELLRYNMVEDIAFGLMGRASKFTAQNLGLTVGPQTGLVM